MCNKKFPWMLEVLHVTIDVNKEPFCFLECTRETRWMDTADEIYREALWNSRRKIPLSTYCVQEIIMTDVTFTAVQLQAVCAGDKRMLLTEDPHQHQEKQVISQHISISIALYSFKNMCFTYRVNEDCLWPTGVIHLIKSSI